MASWSTACPDWSERLLAGRSLVPDLPLFLPERDRALRIFNRLRLPDVIGMPPMSEAAGDWFRAIVGALFGAYDPATDRRMISQVFLAVPKKNGKSTYAAAIMVVALIVNRRPNAEYLLIAPTIEIAAIAYRQAAGIIAADAELAKLFHAQRHLKMLTHRRTGATLQIKAADTDVITGAKSTGILIDETHVFSSKSNAADVFTEVRGSLAARPDGFMLQITTQSKQPPQGVFKAELSLARDVRDGLVDLPLLPVIYELPKALGEDGGWRARRYWGAVNPNLGRSLDETFLEGALTAAEHAGPEALALFASQHFNVEIGLALRSDAWAGATYWLGAVDPTLTLESLIERSEVVVVGIDGGGLDDLLGLCVMGRDRATHAWLAWAHAWAHPDVLQKRQEIASTLRDFEAEGDLTVCATPTQDIEEVAAIVGRVAAAGLLPPEAAVGLDPAGVAAIIDALAGVGLTEKQLAAIPQGYRLSGAVWGSERKLKDGTLLHGGQNLMTWSVGNAKAVQQGNAVLITKQAAGKAKIDPLMAFFDAFQLLTRNPDAQGRSYVEDGEILMV